MKQEINPKMVAIIVAVIAVVVLGIGYKMLFVRPTIPTPNIPKGKEYMLHPTGGEAYQMQQHGLSMPSGAR